MSDLAVLFAVVWVVVAVVASLVSRWVEWLRPLRCACGARAVGWDADGGGLCDACWPIDAEALR